jgi:hypothetical protein
MIINSKKLWLPRIFLVSKIDSMKPVGHNMDSFTTIRSNGEVWYLPGGILVSKCPTNISKFPFDTQTCRLAFSSWGILSSNLILSSVYEKAVLKFFTPHSDWTLQECTTSDGYEPQSGYHEFHVKITIPESMGRTNTSGLIRANSKVGKIIKTTWYSGCRLIVILTWNS